MHSECGLSIRKDFAENRQNQTYEESKQEDKNRKEGKTIVSEKIRMHPPFFFKHAFEDLKHKIPASFSPSFSLDFAPFLRSFL
jgi:hypothetical protein